MRKHVSKIIGGICMLSLGMALPMAASADAVTFNFTGTVDSTSGIFSSASSTISGSYTFDYAAADPLVSSGTLSDLSSGVTLANLVLAGPLPSSVVFTESFSSGAVSFSSPLTTATGVLDLVGIVPGSFSATDSWVLADGSGVTGSIFLNGATVFNPAGLPLLGAGAISAGEVVDSAGNSLNYHLTTLTQAPEIDPASGAAGATLLLAAVLVMQGRGSRKDRRVTTATV